MGYVKKGSDWIGFCTGRTIGGPTHRARWGGRPTSCRQDPPAPGLSKVEELPSSKPADFLSRRASGGVPWLLCRARKTKVLAKDTSCWAAQMGLGGLRGQLIAQGPNRRSHRPDTVKEQVGPFIRCKAVHSRSRLFLAAFFYLSNTSSTSVVYLLLDCRRK
jgi:hypothetical protein